MNVKASLAFLLMPAIIASSSRVSSFAELIPTSWQTDHYYRAVRDVQPSFGGSVIGVYDFHDGHSAVFRVTPDIKTNLTYQSVNQIQLYDTQNLVPTSDGGAIALLVARDRLPLADESNPQYLGAMKVSRDLKTVEPISLNYTAVELLSDTTSRDIWSVDDHSQLRCCSLQSGTVLAHVGQPPYVAFNHIFFYINVDKLIMIDTLGNRRTEKISRLNSFSSLAIAANEAYVYVTVENRKDSSDLRLLRIDRRHPKSTQVSPISIFGGQPITASNDMLAMNAGNCHGILLIGRGEEKTLSEPGSGCLEGDAENNLNVVLFAHDGALWDVRGELKVHRFVRKAIEF